MINLYIMHLRNCAGKYLKASAKAFIRKMKGVFLMKRDKHLDDIDQLPNYMSIAAIVPAVFSIMVYEFLEYMVNIVFRKNPDYDPLIGLGMLVPMALLTEFFTFFLSRALYKKVNQIISGINQVAGGNYDVTLNAKKLSPLTEVAENFNKMTAELRSVETLRNDFINDFSHEFKTPITSINGFARLLLDTEVSKEEQQQYLQIIADESERLAALSNQTLMMSRLDNQQSIPDKAPYSLDEQIKQNIILLSREWNAKKIDLGASLAPVTYVGNADLMSHIWMNLLNNAIKFTPEQGMIDVSMHQENDSILISVSDTGKGMTEDEIHHIFNKYYQADPSHATKGMGLGLSIAHRIVELCGGRIEVTSRPGEGSTFTVILPQTDIHA